MSSIENAMLLEELIRVLSRREAYPVAPAGEVEVRQTHISVLFFAGERVYKVKKPVDLGFLDYSTLQRRRQYCVEEVRLNRRLAPDVYLGVVEINRDRDGTVRIGGPGPAIEYAVEMVRLPAAKMLDARLRRGEIDNARLDALAALLARFHAGCATGPDVDEHGRPEAVTAQVRENLDALRDVAGAAPAAMLTPIARDRLVSFAQAWLETHRATMHQRVAAGRIREGHGDLHAGNICLLDDEADGRIVIYDCIEFAARFRCRDVAGELAFLAMDLDRRGLRAFARYLTRRYAEITDDPELPDVARFYKVHFAAVRGKVAALRARQTGIDAKAQLDAIAEARAYLQLAVAYTLPPALLVMCGLPGTGKSHAARAIARPFEAVILRSDVVRKELAGVIAGSDGGLDEGIYAPDVTRRVYEAMLARAGAALRAGRTVVLDATFSRRPQRAAAFALAAAFGAPAVLVEVTCPEATVRERLARRAVDAQEASDADERVYEHAKGSFESPEEIAAERYVQIESTGDGAIMVGAVLDRLIELA